MKTMLMEVNLSVCPHKVYYEYPQIFSIERTFLKICAFYHVDPDETKSRRRERRFALTRQVSMYLMSTFTNATLAQIGRFFAKDHTTVIHGRETIKDLMFSDPEIKRQVEYLKIQCGL